MSEQNETKPVESIIVKNPKPLKTGEYPATFVDVAQVEGQWGDQLRWTFKLDQMDEYGDNYVMYKWTPVKATSRNITGRVIAAISGKNEGEFKPDDYIGKPVVLAVLKDVNKAGETVNKVKEVFSPDVDENGQPF